MSIRPWSALRLLAAAAVVVLVAACSGDREPEATATLPATATVVPAPTATAAPPALNIAPMAPDGQRILATVEELATGIGPRVAGTGSEKAAADLLAAKFRGYGYEVEVKQFTVSREVSREASLNVLGPEARTIASNPLSSSAASKASGLLVVAGIGRPEDIPASARGAILLIERGELTFQEKVANAQAAGAAGVVIFNNIPGTFFGTLSSASSIPAVSVSMSEGEALTALAQRSAQVEVGVGETPITASHNVIAKPPGASCETVSGGHYDSVPAAPGANDNAGGSATVVEIAGVLASQGKMGNHCFVLFGAEEIGLLGSQAYVQSLSATERQQIKAMLNFDMVGFGAEPWYLIGSSALQDQAAAIARKMGIATQTRNVASTGGGSDHASFLSAGIPALFYYRANDPQWHQPGDIAARMSPELMEEAARMGIAMLESLAAP